MKYKVKVSCDDCTGVNDQGCGWGSPWYFETDDGEVQLFDTYEEAEKVGYTLVAHVRPWDFEVEEVPVG